MEESGKATLQERKAKRSEGEMRAGREERRDR